MVKKEQMIKATIIQDSINKQGKRITTFELEYPRFIHAEFMTHRQFSRNAASSRAIPVEKMHEHIRENTGMPIHWGKNQAGMQANEEVTTEMKDRAIRAWSYARDDALERADYLFRQLGLHKQIANRVTEPFQVMKVVCTSTEWANWYWLRNHKDAQPEIAELARQMYAAHEASTPQLLQPGQWHVPYVTRVFGATDKVMYQDQNGYVLSLEDALQISASCCAQVSYRKSDDSLAKAKAVFARLIESEPMHASPVEHQAKCFECIAFSFGIEEGVTHVSATLDAKDDYTNACGSGNFYGWIQHRQLIKGNTKW